jgi:hypothetical protein
MKYVYPAGMAKHPKRPRDPNQLAKLVVDLATGEAGDPSPPVGTPSSEPARRGGLKGGDARARAGADPRTPRRDSEGRR